MANIEDGKHKIEMITTKHVRNINAIIFIRHDCDCYDSLKLVHAHFRKKRTKVSFSHLNTQEQTENTSGGNSTTALRNATMLHPRPIKKSSEVSKRFLVDF